MCNQPSLSLTAREKAEKTFAFTYMNIMKDDGSIIRDGLHEFYVYKVTDSRAVFPQGFCNSGGRRVWGGATFCDVVVLGG